MADARAEMMELSGKLRPIQQELNELMYSLKVDESQIRAKVTEEAQIQADIIVLRAKAFAEIQPPITGEEFEKFKAAETAPRPMMRPTPPPPSATPPVTVTNQSGMGVQPKQ